MDEATCVSFVFGGVNEGCVLGKDEHVSVGNLGLV